MPGSLNSCRAVQGMAACTALVAMLRCLWPVYPRQAAGEDHCPSSLMMSLAVHCCHWLAFWLLLLLAADEGLDVALSPGGQPHSSGDVEVHDSVSRMEQACSQKDVVNLAQLLRRALMQQRLSLQLLCTI